jgi:hypothetical protein
MIEDLYNPQETNTTSSVEKPTNLSGTTVPSGFLPDFGFWLILGLALVLGLSLLGVFLYNKIRDIVFQKSRLSKWQDTQILEVSLPKESKEQAQKDGGNARDDKDMLAVGEQIFAILSEYATDKRRDKMFFREEKFSFELVNIEKETRFWITCSQEISQILARQIVAIYPKASVLTIDKTSFFKPETVGYGVELDLAVRYELPFRTYKNIDQDPLNTLTNAINGLLENESAAIQMVIGPVKDKWQSNPRVLASKIQQGQSPKEILFPSKDNFASISKIVKGLWKFFAPSSKKEDSGGDSKQRKIDLTGKEQAIQLTPQQQEIVKKLEEKSSRQGFVFNLRLVAAAETEGRAKQIVDGIVPAFQVFDNRPFNNFKKKKTDPKKVTFDFAIRSLDKDLKKILNTEELNSIWHLPNYLTQTSNIRWLASRKPPIPLLIPGPGDGNVLIGTAKSGGIEKDVYIKTEDRLRHCYSLGGTGTGKSQLMGHVILEDIAMGNGVCVVDPHGELVDDLLLKMPKEALDRVILFSPSITDFPIGMNMLEVDPTKPTEKTLVIDTLFSIWDKLYDLKVTGGPMFEQYMKNALRLIMSHPESGSTLMEIQKVLTDEEYRTYKLALCDEPDVVDFWEKVATQATGEGSLENMVPYFISKLAPFVTNDFLRPIIGQQKSSINFRQAMDNKKILLLKLEKSLIGESASYLLGMVIIGNLLRAGMGRADGLHVNEDGTTKDILPADRVPFFVYIDEMQNFLFDAIPQALEEIRKYKVGFYLAHQFVKQVINKGDERIKDSIMNNCANKFIYRIGADDAKYLEPFFSPTLTMEDLMNPEKYTINTRILVDGQQTTPFNFSPKTLFERENDLELKRQIIETTKQKYGKARDLVEKEIRERGDLLF